MIRFKEFHGGYNSLIAALIDGSDIRLNTDFFGQNGLKCWLIKYCLPVCIDEYFDYQLGKLEYRSLIFEHECLSIPDFQGNAVVNYNEKEILLNH